MPHPDVDAEQAYLDEAYRCLAAMRDRTARTAGIAEGAAQAVDSAIAQQHLAHRLGTLDVDVPGLSFGRLDGDDGARWYVGRRHVEDARGDPVVVDWRADVAVPFYRATAVDPLGLRRRRRFMMTGRRLDDLFDEVFDDPDSVDAAHHGGIPDPLLAELERERTGEMRDIVATIAAEQDEVIRAPLDTCLVVQGGPGTGKTAVGLHRAAFLLYEHRRQLDAAGVLVVGPNPIFLRYIAQVLPSLGETAVRQTTLERLLAGTAYRRRGRDGDDTARLKGDARLARVLAHAVTSSVQTPEDRIEGVTTWGTVRLDPDAVFDAVADIHGRGVPHNVGRAALRTRLVRLARHELVARRGEELASLEAVDASLRGDRGWQRALDRIWPPLSASALVRRMLTNRNALRAAATGLLDADEQALLLRPPTSRVSDEPWTLDDLALLDEADALLSGSPPRAYGHVVVDEAQDLSAMGFRALARRSPNSSMTVLGDLAQATAPAAQSSWDDVIDHLGGPATAHRADLDLGYRVPAAIIDVANGLLAEAAPGVTPCRSVRLDGDPPRFVAVEASAGAEGLHDAIAAAVAGLTGRYTSVAVIAAPELAPPAHRLPGATMLAPADAKGLEFDAVVVAEPAAIAGGTPQGLRLLYVALTRAVQELVVVHALPLPAALASGAGPGPG